MSGTASTVVIPHWAEGRQGFGQGGWCSATFAATIAEPVVIDLRVGVPLETPMAVVAADGGWELRDGDVVVMRARPRDRVAFPTTAAVDVGAAAEASARFDRGPDDHAAPACFSCGLRERTMRVWPGPLDDGSDRLATTWTPPEWVAGADGAVPEAVVWTAMDCAQGFFVGSGPVRRRGFTVRFEADVYRPVRVGETYVVVGFNGDGNGWDGRKREAAAAVFDRSGALMAAAASLWVEPRSE